MYKEIQYLRGVCVLMVVWTHAGFPKHATALVLKMLHLTAIAEAPGLANYFDGMGNAAMDVFFVISGYVVSKSFFSTLAIDLKANFIANLETNMNRLKAFYTRRFFRLFPVAFLLIALQTIEIYPNQTSQSNLTEQLMGLLSHLSIQSDMDTTTIVKNGVPLRTMNHYWSLAVEERFYLLFPFLILLARTPYRFMAMAVGIIVTLALGKALDPPDATKIYVNGFLRFDAFMFGILVYLLQKYTAVFHKLFSKTHSRILMNALTLLILLTLARLPVTIVTGNEPKDIIHYSETYYYYLLSYTLSAVLVTWSIQDKGYVLGIPGFRHILAWIGDRSYIIYIFQFLYIHLTYVIAVRLHIDGGNYIAFTALLLAITCICTELIARLCELPFRRYGRQAANRMIAIGEGQA